MTKKIKITVVFLILYSLIICYLISKNNVKIENLELKNIEQNNEIDSLKIQIEDLKYEFDMLKD